MLARGRALRLQILGEQRRHFRRHLDRAIALVDQNKGYKPQAFGDFRRLLESKQIDAVAMRVQAMADVRRQVADLAIQAAERVVRSSLDGARQRQLIEEFLTTAPSGTGGR